MCVCVCVCEERILESIDVCDMDLNDCEGCEEGQEHFVLVQVVLVPVAESRRGNGSDAKEEEV